MPAEPVIIPPDHAKWHAARAGETSKTRAIAALTGRRGNPLLMQHVSEEQP